MDFLQTKIQGSGDRHLDGISSPRLKVGLVRGTEWGKFRSVGRCHSRRSAPHEAARLWACGALSLAFQLKNHENQNKKTCWDCVKCQHFWPASVLGNTSQNLSPALKLKIPTYCSSLLLPLPCPLCINEIFHKN